MSIKSKTLLKVTFERPEKYRINKKEKSSCSVCFGHRLIQVLDLPKFPLTGIYVKKTCPGKYPSIDQALMLCVDCGHAQLLYVVDPDYVYLKTYSHRSSQSDIARQGNDFYFSFLEKTTKGCFFQRIVEVGCNDLYLLKKTQNKGEKIFGIDPIWHGKPKKLQGKIQVIGKFVEEVNFKEEIGAPDLILSAHTFEHIDEPRSILQKLISVAAEKALFIVEVPAFDSLLRGCRFDQVFHQHIQYFSVASFKKLISDLGAEYLSHAFNYGYWGGTLLMAFRKSGRIVRKKKKEDSRPTVKLVHKRLDLFQNQMKLFMKLIESAERPIYGYGAAQMLPALAYHMKSDLSFLEAILDDNPARNGFVYPDLNVPIRLPHAGLNLESASIVITALDSLRAILKNLIPRKPKQILVPLGLW